MTRRALGAGRLRTALAGMALLTAIAGLLVACGHGQTGSGSAGTGRSTASSPSGGSSSSSSARRGFGDRALFDDPKVRACLQAAGIALPTTRPSGARPSGFPTRFRSGERPSGFPTGARPSGARPSGARPSGVRGGFGGAGGEQFEKIQAALKACGIALPSRTAVPGGARPTAAPNGPGATAAQSG